MQNLILLILCACTYATSSAQSIPPGIVWEDDRYHSLPLKWNYGAALENIPSAYTIRPFCPRVVLETTPATSPVWAAVWYGQTMSEAVGCGERNTDTITLNAFSPLYIYRLLNQSGDCETAVSLIDVLESMNEYGSPRFHQFSDLCPAKLPDEVAVLASKNKINGYNKLFNAFDPPALKTAAMKLALYAKHPVIIGMTTPASFRLAKDFWQSREMPDTTRQSAQALCVVGYNDQKLGGAFEVVNNQGPSWGNKGFSWVSYADMAKFARYGFELLGGSVCDTIAPAAKIVFFEDNGAVINAFSTDNQYHKVTRPHGTGTRFKIDVQSEREGFIYILADDSKNKPTILFPQEKIIPYLNGNLTLPDEHSWFQLEGGRDENRFYFLFTQRQIDRISLTEAIKTHTLFSLSESAGFNIHPDWKDRVSLGVLQLDQF